HNSGWRKCLEYCRGKKVFFDIGAHIGLYCIPASIEMGTTGKVFAFEPGLRNYETLNRHIAINKIDNIYTENCIVGNENARTLFYEDTRNANPMNSLVLYKNTELYEKTYRQQITLDAFCYKHNVVPDVIKIDVEGAELFVLNGAQEFLKQHQPTVF
nr:FkbM family methyltransferase [Bacteroidota bacterium]